MRKFTIFTLVLALTLTLTACGRGGDTPTETTPIVTQAPTEQVTIPTIDPTMGTNIPDPEVDTSMPDMMDPTGESGSAAGGNGSDTQGPSGKASGQANGGD